MNWTKFLPIFLVTLVVQTVFIPYVRLFGVIPDLLLVMVAISSILAGRRYGVIVGALAGVFQDIFSSTVYVHTISKIIIGYIIGFIKENILGGEEAISAVIVFIVSVIASVIDISLLYFFMGRSVSSAYYIFITIIIYSFYNIVFVPVLYPMIKSAVVEK